MSDDWLKLFREIGQNASNQTLKLYGKPEGAERLGRGAGGDITLKLDKIVEDMVVAKLEARGNVKLISEELGVKEFGEPEVVVVADPLDGTANAREGIPLFATALSVLELDAKMCNLQFGYVRNLVTGDEFWAEAGKGAYFNSDKISASQHDHLGVIGVEMYPHTQETLSRTFKVMESAKRTRILGSLALDLGFTAKGILDAALDLRNCCRLIDLTAGKLILEEAGGIITDDRGNTLDNLEVNIGSWSNMVAAGNNKLHEQILELID